MGSGNEMEFSSTQNGHWEVPRYEEIAASLLFSDLAPYIATLQIVTSKGGDTFLDFGCHQGNSSARLLGFGVENLGVTRVMGIDNNSIHINAARNQFSRLENLKFETTGYSRPIPMYEDKPYDGVAMTFVHPTISRSVVLEDSFGRISEVVRDGAPVVLLGLHPGSLGKGYYTSYQHQLPYGGAYRDGQQFRNKLVVNGEVTADFDDHCWTDTTVQNMLYRAGFSNVHIVPFSTNLDGSLAEYQSIINWSLQIAGGIYQRPMQNLPEYQKGTELYQLFIAYR